MENIAMIGSGWVGRSSGRVFLEKGHKILFSDINPEVITKLKEEGLDAVSMFKLHERIKEINNFLVSVSTPTSGDEIQLNFIRAAIAGLGELTAEKDDYFLVVVRSTVPPGTTEEILIPIFEKYSGKKAGKDFGICMNPEYLRQESAEKDFANPKTIIAGCYNNDPKAFERINKIYSPLNVPVEKVSISEAEMHKYIHNLFNATKISFFNEMRMLAEKVGVNADKIFPLVAKSAEASYNPQYGIRDFGPYGGTCLPKDTLAFHTWAKNRHKKSLPLLKSVIKVNEMVKDKLNNH